MRKKEGGREGICERYCCTYKHMEFNTTQYLSGSLSVNRVRAEMPQVSSKALIRVWDDVSVV
jgi:hypothetical protein